MKVLSLSNHTNPILSLCTGRAGIHFFDSETLKLVYHHKFNNEFIISQAFVKSLNLLITGSNTGSIYAHDLDECNFGSPLGFEYELEDRDENIKMIRDIDTPIQSLLTSPLPEEKYLAVGTNAGLIEIYFTQTLAEEQSFRYYHYSEHLAPVLSLCFIPFNDDFYLASVCASSKLIITCLKQRMLMYKCNLGHSHPTPAYSSL